MSPFARGETPDPIHISFSKKEAQESLMPLFCVVISLAENNFSENAGKRAVRGKVLDFLRLY